jgi:hypothetical protein
MDSAEAAIHERWKATGFDSLLPEEQGYIAAWWLAMEVSNGGFSQYFYNSSGDSALLALQALEQSGAEETRSLLSKALCVFNQVGGYVASREERFKALKRLPTMSFDALDSQFYDGEETFMSNVLSRAVRARAQVGV